MKSIVFGLPWRPILAFIASFGRKEKSITSSLFFHQQGSVSSLLLYLQTAFIAQINNNSTENLGTSLGMAELAQRVVPGAPPPAPLSKAQKKKRRGGKKEDEAQSPVALSDAHAAALTERAPDDTDIKSGAVAEELVVLPEPAKEDQPEQTVAKSSPVIELLMKRIKALHKKIVSLITSGVSLYLLSSTTFFTL